LRLFDQADFFHTADEDKLHKSADSESAMKPTEKTLREEIAAFQRATDMLVKEQRTAIAEALETLAHSSHVQPRTACDVIFEMGDKIRASRDQAQLIYDRLSKLQQVTPEEHRVLGWLASDLQDVLQEANDAYAAIFGSLR
jgi:hypothetical protein